jgi:hypothetical protein
LKPFDNEAPGKWQDTILLAPLPGRGILFSLIQGLRISLRYLRVPG